MNTLLKDIMAKVDSILTVKELKDKPRAFLLLRLCQLFLLVSRDTAEQYWNKLAPLKNKISKELQEDYENISLIIESTSKYHAKGFAAKIINDIESAQKLIASDIEKAKLLLHDCEMRLKKRRLPFGKTQVWIALVETWAYIDRKYALNLIGKIPSNVQKSFITRLNNIKPIQADEWNIAVEKINIKKVIPIIIEILDKNQILHLPKELLLGALTEIINSMRIITTPQGQKDLDNAFIRYVKLVKLQIGTDKANLIPLLLEEMYDFLVNTRSLDLIWIERFMLIANVLQLGVSLKVLTNETMEQLIDRTPSYLTNFVKSFYAALITSSSNGGNNFKVLMEKVEQDTEAETCFLVTLVKQGLCKEAMSLAEKSYYAKELLPHLRRAWLCTHPESSSKAISVKDMTGDPIGEFFAQSTIHKRIKYLREVTNGGRISLPGAMWAGVGTDVEPEGLRGFWKKITTLMKTLDEMATEYVTKNPLYSSYKVATKKENQFTEYLRIACFGEYSYKNIDNVLLETIVAWRQEDAKEVRTLLHAMWEAIKPDDNILKVEFLRNSILERCRNIFASDPEVLFQDFLTWFKKKLVDKYLSWQVGKTQFTLRYPKEALLQFCLLSAIAVDTILPKLRDEILLSGLSKFKGEPQIVEAIAQLYNKDKEILDIIPPIKVEPGLVEAWQIGIIKNAIPYILKTMFEQKSK
jgi:hypothetical protein